ncbi:MAG: septum site-determining protein MinC [Thiothrix nivea]|nr:MAG: septum site-determining protein MinC [Thiothrix nivea]
MQFAVCECPQQPSAKECCSLSDQALELKGEMSLLSVLLLSVTDMDAIQTALETKRKSAHQLLDRSPVIVDCQKIAEQAGELDFARLAALVSETGLIPVGIRNLPETCEAMAAEAGWALLRQGSGRSRAPAVTVKDEPAAENQQHPEQAATEAKGDRGPEPVRLRVIERPVRSGQQVYCPEGDIVVMQQTSAGSELLAGGSVHVYGALRGRVLAGVQGDKSARIFCQQLEAELISIAGRYRLLDDIEDDVKGQAVMVQLDGEKLKITPI